MKKSYRSFIFYIVLVILVSSVSTVTGDEETSFVVIVNSDNPVSSLTRSQVSKIFLKKVIQWDSGGKIALIEQGEVKEDFSEKIHNKDKAAIDNYWTQMIFSGRRVPPNQVNTDIEVIEFIEKNRNAIGYVSKNAALENVKILKVNF